MSRKTPAAPFQFPHCPRRSRQLLSCCSMRQGGRGAAYPPPRCISDRPCGINNCWLLSGPRPRRHGLRARQATLRRCCRRLTENDLVLRAPHIFLRPPHLLRQRAEPGRCSRLSPPLLGPPPGSGQARLRLRVPARVSGGMGIIGARKGRSRTRAISGRFSSRAAASSIARCAGAHRSADASHSHSLVARSFAGTPSASHRETTSSWSRETAGCEVGSAPPARCCFRAPVPRAAASPPPWAPARRRPRARGRAAAPRPQRRGGLGRRPRAPLPRENAGRALSAKGGSEQGAWRVCVCGACSHQRARFPLQRVHEPGDRLHHLLAQRRLGRGVLTPSSAVHTG